MSLFKRFDPPATLGHPNTVQTVLVVALRPRSAGAATVAKVAYEVDLDEREVVAILRWAAQRDQQLIRRIQPTILSHDHAFDRVWPIAAWPSRPCLGREDIRRAILEEGRPMSLNLLSRTLKHPRKAIRSLIEHEHRADRFAFGEVESWHKGRACVLYTVRGVRSDSGGRHAA